MAHAFNPSTQETDRVTGQPGVQSRASSKIVHRETSGSVRALRSKEHAWAGLIFLLSISFTILVWAGHGGGACL